MGRRARGCPACERRVQQALERLRAWAWPSLIQALDDPAYFEDWQAYDAARAALAACRHRDPSHPDRQ